MVTGRAGYVQKRVFLEVERDILSYEGVIEIRLWSGLVITGDAQWKFINLSWNVKNKIFF